MKPERNPFDGLARPDERTMAFIDGANLYSAVRDLEFDIDYSKLRQEFEKVGRFIRANYYTGLIDNPEQYSPLRKLVDWLDYHRYNVVTKPAKEIYDEEHDRTFFKGNMDVEIAVEMLEAGSYVDHVLLFSGDGDFCAVIEALQRKGVRTTVISTLKTRQVADELRRVADAFVELDDLRPFITRQDRQDRQDHRDLVEAK